MPRLRLAVLALLLSLCPLSAPQAATPAVVLLQPWIRWLPGDLPLGGYVELVNHTAHTLHLTGADSPDFARIGLHRSLHTGGKERMVPVKSLAIPARGQLPLAPGGYHLMLMHPTHTVHVGDRLTIRLHFADGLSLSGRFVVRAPGAHE